MKYLLLFLIFLTPFFSYTQNTETEAEFINEVNLLRKDPKGYINNILKYKNTLTSAEIDVLNKELIPILDTIKPMCELSYDDSIRKMMNNRKLDTTSLNGVQHDIGCIKGRYGLKAENISATASLRPFPNIKMSVISLLIDCEIPSRGHRKALLNNDFKITAVRKVSFKVNDFYAVFWIQVFIDPIVHFN